MPLKLSEPNKHQRALIELLADPDDFRSIGDKAVSVGYDDEYGRQLARDATFADWVLVRTRELVKGKLPKIYQGVVRDAIDTGLEPVDRHRAVKLVMQTTGEIQPNAIQITQNTTVLQIPKRLAQHLEARREILREITVIEHKPTNGNGNGNGHT